MKGWPRSRARYSIRTLKEVKDEERVGQKVISPGSSLEAAIYRRLRIQSQCLFRVGSSRYVVSSHPSEGAKGWGRLVTPVPNESKVAQAKSMANGGLF